MGTLDAGLAPLAEALADRPRVYADANLPRGVVGYMRERLGWDVLFVVEHDDLRRARDLEHFRMARRLHRTLVTLDRDYLDPARFPPQEGAGILVVSAPDERGLGVLLQRVDRGLFHQDGRLVPLPLERRTLRVTPDWWPEGQAPAAGAGGRARNAGGRRGDAAPPQQRGGRAPRGRAREDSRA